LDWVLVQQYGDFMVTVISSDEQTSQVVGLRAGGRLMFYHEDSMSLPLVSSGLAAACGGTKTCARLREMNMVGLEVKTKSRRRG
jgi:hypothetical protein